MKCKIENSQRGQGVGVMPTHQALIFDVATASHPFCWWAEQVYTLSRRSYGGSIKKVHGFMIAVHSLKVTIFHNSSVRCLSNQAIIYGPSGAYISKIQATTTYRIEPNSEKHSSLSTK
mgnify:CR=1 FL=1